MHLARSLRATTPLAPPRDCPAASHLNHLYLTRTNACLALLRYLYSSSRDQDLASPCPGPFAQFQTTTAKQKTTSDHHCDTIQHQSTLNSSRRDASTRLSDACHTYLRGCCSASSPHPLCLPNQNRPRHTRQGPLSQHGDVAASHHPHLPTLAHHRNVRRATYSTATVDRHGIVTGSVALCAPRRGNFGAPAECYESGERQSPRPFAYYASTSTYLKRPNRHHLVWERQASSISHAHGCHSQFTSTRAWARDLLSGPPKQTIF